jgi:hypothetical protein
MDPFEAASAKQRTEARFARGDEGPEEAQTSWGGRMPLMLRPHKRKVRGYGRVRLAKAGNAKKDVATTTKRIVRARREV